eukprot:SAG22_NODE_1067_length_5742_cov_15.152224_4_plen_103_part_00
MCLHGCLFAGDWCDISVQIAGNAADHPSCHPCLSRQPASGFCPNRGEPDKACMCCGTLSLVEEQTNHVMWSMFAAPLEIAADVRSIRACACDTIHGPAVMSP